MTAEICQRLAVLKASQVGVCAIATKHYDKIPSQFYTFSKWFIFLESFPSGRKLSTTQSNAADTAAGRAEATRKISKHKIDECSVLAHCGTYNTTLSAVAFFPFFLQLCKNTRNNIFSSGNCLFVFGCCDDDWATKMEMFGQWAVCVSDCAASDERVDLIGRQFI